jgi:HAD superfamily hydrolase (TIGR01509 family)
MPNPLKRPAAVIFDMDGVLVDSNPFHLQKWIELFDARGVAYRRDELPELILGHRNDTAFRHFFGATLGEEEMARLENELEVNFRNSFGPHAKPMPGLDRLIRELDAARLPMAVASSAMKENVEFVVDALGYRKYFQYLISGDAVRKPKPDPEIYLIAAARLGVQPAECVAFEDSFPGIDAVKAAGMKCIAIASTFPFEAVRACAGHAIRSFEEIRLDDLGRLFGGQI